MRAVFLHMRAANRASRGFLNLLRRRVVRHRAEDFRNHVVAPANEHARTDLDALSLDVVEVIQRCALNRRTREFDGTQVRQRREFARAPDFPSDFLHDRGGLLGGKLVCHRPAREFFGRAELFAQSKIGDFDDHAVDQKIQRTACLFRTVDLALEVFRRVAIANKRADGEAVFGKKREHLALIGQFFALDVTHVVAKDIKFSAGGYFGIKVSQRACRSVSRVFQRLIARFVEFFQNGQAHDAFALHFHLALERYRSWNRTNGEQLFQHAVAGDAVAARCALYNASVIVGQADSQPVELVLQRELNLHSFGGFHRAVCPICEGFFRAHFVEAVESANVRMG